MLIFIASFLVDLYFWVKDPKDPMREKVFVGTRVICMVILFYFLTIEIRQIRLLDSIYDYFDEFWSLNEIFLYPAYVSYVTVGFSKPEWLYAIKSLQFLLVVSSFIKLCFFLRIFD